MDSRIVKDILATVVYYDVMDFPLTSFEIWKYCIRADYHCETTYPAATLAMVVEALDGEPLKKFIARQNGFYFLKGRETLVQSRIFREKIATAKLKRLRKITWWLRFVPYVRMVGVTGRLAMKNGTARSDLDLLVVLKAGKIWTGRTLITIFLHALGLRRHGAKIANRVCLNYFITDESLEIATKDLFSANEYTFLYPLFGYKIFTQFQLRNAWLRNIKPHYDVCYIAPRFVIGDSTVAHGVRAFGEFLFANARIEQWLRRAEKKRIMRNPKTHSEGSLVHASDAALVFLPNPRGPKTFELFKKRLSELME